MDQKTVQKFIASALRNWQKKYVFVLDDYLEEFKERCSNITATDIAEKTICKAEKKRLLAECENLKKKCRRLENLWCPDSRKKYPIQEAFIETYRYIDNMQLRLQVIKTME